MEKYKTLGLRLTIKKCWIYDDRYTKTKIRT